MSMERLKQIKKQIENVRREIGKEALSREDRIVPDEIYNTLTKKIDSYLEDIRNEIVKEHEGSEAIITIYGGQVVKIDKDGIHEDGYEIAKHNGERIFL